MNKSISKSLGRNARRPAAPAPAQKHVQPARAGRVPLRKRRRSKKIHFHVPSRTQALLLNFPVVRDEMVFIYRLSQLRAALALLATGKFSMRTAADALDLLPSQLCVWLRGWRERGADALRPVRRGRAARRVETCRLDVFFCQPHHPAPAAIGSPDAQSPVAADKEGSLRPGRPAPVRRIKIAPTPTRKAAKATSGDNPT
jgi:hypothetical protein